MLLRYSPITLVFTLFLLCALVVPVSGSPPIYITNTTTSAQLQTLLNGTAGGSTIILENGTYLINDILITKDVTLESDPLDGGNAQNTIIDGIDAPANSQGVFYNNTNSGVSTTITLINLTIRNGYSVSTNGGGAIHDYGDITAVSSDFINDTSPGHDGGTLSIHGFTANITVSGATFINSTGLEGGAIYDDSGYVFVNSSSFVNCHATLLAGVVYGADGVNATFSRFSNITSVDNAFIETNSGDIYAPDNWWGTNNPGISTIFKGGGTYTINPWLNLTVTSTPVTAMGQTSKIQANLLYYNDSTSQSGIIPTDGIPVSFTVSPVTSGTMIPPSGTFTNMFSPISTFTPLIGGPVTVDVSVDSAIIPINFDVAPVITGITPAASLNTAPIPVTITGSGFYNTTTIWPTVNLTRSGYSNITLTGVSVSSVTSINGIIPAGIPAGVWNIVVTNPDGLEGTTGSVTFDAQISTPKNNNNGRPSYGQPESNPDNGYTGPQPASQGGAPVKPAVVRQEAPPETTPISPVITALAPVQNPTILAMVILTLQEFQFWLILAVIIIILIAILRRWWIKRQVL
ncbi:hypothetical protein [Methanoregula sp.]|uniref:hypothetical protein n=1 Tax=Methanoregula sp. TaxID=2052170 RepID=UPI003BB0312F